MTKWLFPEEPTEIPYSELAMHVGAAGQKIKAFIRTEPDYCYIAYGSNPHSPYNITHGLISEVLPFGSDAYNDCIQSELQEYLNILNLVRIIYFKPSGKYYTEGYYNTIYEDYRIFDEVKEMFKNNIAPGLNECDPDFTAVVLPQDVAYPAMIRCSQ